MVGVRGTCFVIVIGLAVIIGSIMITTAGEPELYIDSHYDGETVNAEKITVYGHVRGTGGAVVELVTVNGVKATGDTEWSADVSLLPGPNTITVVATDDIGDSATRTITVILDAEPTPTPAGEPKLYIDSHYDGETVNAGKITVYGHVRGTGGAVVELVTVNGVKATGDTKWSAEVSLLPCPNTITVVATDDIGNSATKTIIVIVPTPTPTPAPAPAPTPTATPTTAPPKIQSGAISISSLPTGAEVYLDNIYKGLTHCTITDVLYGDHILKLSLEGYQDWSDTVHVTAGETTPVNATLTPETTCEEGYKDCYTPWGDCETNIYADNDNCGDCGKKCPDGYFCLMGWCVENTTENKEKLAIYYLEQYKGHETEKRYEVALNYLLKAKDIYIDLDMGGMVEEIEARIKEIREKKGIIEFIHLICEVAIAVTLAAFFGYIFDKYRRPKKVPLLVVVAGSIGVFIVAFCALRLWVLPMFY